MAAAGDLLGWISPAHVRARISFVGVHRLLARASIRACHADVRRVARRSDEGARAGPRARSRAHVDSVCRPSQGRPHLVDLGRSRVDGVHVVRLHDRPRLPGAALQHIQAAREPGHPRSDPEDCPRQRHRHERSLGSGCVATIDAHQRQRERHVRHAADHTQ